MNSQNNSNVLQRCRKFLDHFIHQLVLHIKAVNGRDSVRNMYANKVDGNSVVFQS